MMAGQDFLFVSKHLRIDSGWLSGVSHCPSPNYNARPSSEVSLLVIHNISLPPDQYGGGYVHDFFQNTLDCSVHPYFETVKDLQVSAHCLIDRDGALTQFVSFDDRAWHAGVSSFLGRENCNDYAIGVELEGSDHVPYTNEQYATLVKLSQCLMREYPEITAERIVGHSDIAPERKSDPGAAFDWKAYLSMLD